MFTVYPKFGLSLTTKNLDQVLSFVHKFERSDLMDKGDKVFSITYLIGYALTNSHHSIDYKKKEYIEIDDVFSDIGKIEETKFSEITPIENSWAIDIAKGKRLIGSKPTLSHHKRSGEPSNRELLKSMSKRIDQYSENFEKMKKVIGDV